MIFSLFVLIVLAPVFLILAILILIEDGHPIIYKQMRSGKNNIPFEIYKFRSMKIKKTINEKNNEIIYNWKNGVPDDFIFKTTKTENPNVTKVGKFIRKYSLDELPQFINVLKGDMSIIGPRPEITEITKCYNSIQRQRLLVKPGITGCAQVNGRSDMNHGEKIRYDLYYVNNFGIVLDIKVFLKTIFQVLIGKGSV